MTLTDSQIRSIRERLVTYSDDMLCAMLETKKATMQECLETCPDIMDDEHPLVREYHKAKIVYNAVMEEQERRKTNAPIESLPGMSTVETHSHTMIGR